VFDHVASLLPAPRSRVLFLDDNTLNVEAAASAGFAAARVSGIVEAERELARAGVLETGSLARTEPESGPPRGWSA
jgi:hypothetical protein